MDVIGGTPSALTIPFMVNGQPVAPDVGSVSYTVRDHLVAPLAGLIDIPYETTATSFKMIILVPASAHQIEAARRFERRSIVVNFKVQGSDAQIVRNYRVVPEFLHSTTVDQVRGFIGIEQHELPDDDIDLLTAYLAVEKVVTADRLVTALSSGTTDEISANTMICMRAVLDVLPSAKQRMAQSEKNGVKEFSRVDLKELDKLKVEAEARYQEAMEAIVIQVNTTPTFFLVSINTDAITG